MAERKSTYRSIEIVRKTSDNEQAQSGVEVLAENIMHDNWDGFGLRLIIEHEFELYIMVGEGYSTWSHEQTRYGQSVWHCVNVLPLGVTPLFEHQSSLQQRR